MYMHLRLKCLCAKTFCTQCFFFARDFSLTERAFWRAEQLRWVETNFKEMRKVDQRSDEMKTVEKNLLRWHVRRDGMRWEELRWGEKSAHDLRWDEVSSAKCKCEVQVWSVKSAVWSVRKVIAWRCIAPGSRAGHVLGQQHCNSFALSTRARAWLAHGACKILYIDGKGLIVYPWGNFRPASCGYYWYASCGYYWYMINKYVYQYLYI